MIKVLMIDDNESLINMVSEYFSSNGSNVSIVLKAFVGEEGIEIAEQHQKEYDLILLDLIMPKKDGMYVLEKLNE